ncbi:MAG: hydroxypyruvate isomerase, partial [Mesorhizobium sp.]
VAKAITYAQALGCEQVNCLAGIAPQGVERSVLEDVFAENLAFAAQKLEQAGIRLLIEPINTRDIPGFFLNYSDHALALIDRVG